MYIFGVVTVILEKGILADISAISIRTSINRFKKIDKKLAIGNKKYDIITTMNPKIVATPANGTARTLDIKKVKEKVLKWYAINGINRICAETVTINPFHKYS